MGFMTKSEINKLAKQEIDITTLQSHCGPCGLYKSCKSPKMEVSGQGLKGILVIDDSPSISDDQNKIQFGGNSGRYLSKVLTSKGINLRTDCWSTNVVRCNNDIANKDLGKYVEFCKGYLLRLIYELNPKYILILGKWGLHAILAEDFSNREVERWHGFSFPDDKYRTIIGNTINPKVVESNEKDYLLRSCFERDMDRLLSDAIVMRYKDHVDYESLVECSTDYHRVIAVLDHILRTKPALYFDYETSGLKPYRTGHIVASIAFSTSGKKAFAFPIEKFWTTDQKIHIIKIWRAILADPKIHKIAHSLKMEDCWSKVIFGQQANGWIWDTMETAHIIDNRSEYSGLKFQAFIHFGVRPYNKHIEPYLQAEEGTEFNRVLEIPTKELLIYNGLDCIFGYNLYDLQKSFLSGKKGLLNANTFFLKGAVDLSGIQRVGICVDEKYYKDTRNSLTLKIKTLKRELTNGREAKEFRNHFGRDITITSNKDLGLLFYEVLGAKPVYTGNVDARGMQNYKTDKETLIRTGLPYVSKLIEMKKLEKARGTYLAQFHRESFNGCMHPNFNLHIPRSYRSSSSNPNFQNNPKRDEMIMKAIRAGIIPWLDDEALSEIDFAGAEVITSSSYHRDPTFIAYLKDKDSDMHRDQAIDLWQLHPTELNDPLFTPEEKGRAKKIRFYAKNNWTFAQFYGDWYDSCATNLWENNITQGKLLLPSGKPLFDHCKQIGIYSLDEFKEHCQTVERKLWDERFPVYTKWKKDIAKFFAKNGYIETFFGFRFTGLMDRKQCANYPIQGTSFHLLLYTLHEVLKFVKDNKMRTRIIGQIHDSIIASVPKDEIHFYHKSVAAIIENLHKKFSWMTVMMEAECSVTKLKRDGGNFSKFYEIKPSMLHGDGKLDLQYVYR